MSDDTKKRQGGFKFDLPTDASATQKPPHFSEDHDPERDLGRYGEEPALFSNVKETTSETSMEKELKEQIDWLHDQVRDISNLKGGEKLTSDQTEILKRYLGLKETEVRDLRDQQDHYKSFIARMSQELEKAQLRIRSLLTDMETLRTSEEELRKEIRAMKSQHDEVLLRLTSEYETRIKRAGQYESQVEDLMKKRDQWRERIKEELKRIKLKERELENRYELLKRDMQALLDSKDRHSLELKKKNDALELEMETLEEKLVASSRRIGSVESKKRRLVETMKLALTLLESIDKDDTSDLGEGSGDSNSGGERKAG